MMAIDMYAHWSPPELIDIYGAVPAMGRLCRGHLACFARLAQAAE